MWEKTKAFVSEHPWGAAAIIFVIGLILIWLFLPRGGKATSSQDLQPYYNAQGAAIAAGADVYGAQIQANAATAISKMQSDAAIQLATIAAGVQNHQYDAELEGIRTSTAAELAALQNNNATSINLANIQADTAKDASAAALTLGSKQLDVSLQEHLSDNQTNVTNTSNLAYYDYAKTSAALSTQQVLAQLNNNQANNQIYYNYLTSHEGYLNDQALTSIRGTTGLAALVATLQAGRPGVAGIWTPTTGQITIANSTIGGAVDPNVLAQVASNPWLIGR